MHSFCSPTLVSLQQQLAGIPAHCGLLASSSCCPQLTSVCLIFISLLSLSPTASTSLPGKPYYSLVAVIMSPAISQRFAVCPCVCVCVCFANGDFVRPHACAHTVYVIYHVATNAVWRACLRVPDDVLPRVNFSPTITPPRR